MHLSQEALFVVSAVWDSDPLWWAMVDSETRHLLEQSSCSCLCVCFQKKPQYRKEWHKPDFCPMLQPGHGSSMCENCLVWLSTAISSMSVVVSEVCLWKWIVHVRKLLFAILSFYQQVLLKVFQNASLSVFHTHTHTHRARFKSRDPWIKMLAPRGVCRITGFVKSTREIHVFIFIICWWVKMLFAGKNFKLAMVRVSHRMVAFLLSSNGAVIIKSGLRVLRYLT